MSQDIDRNIKRASCAAVGFIVVVVLIGGAVLYAFVFAR